MFRLVLRGVVLEVSGDDDCASGQNCDGAFEMSYELSDLLGEHGVLHQQIVVDALSNSELGANLVSEASDGKRKGGVLLVDIREEHSRFLTLELIPHIELSLENCGSELRLLGLALAAGHENVEADNITRSELEFLNEHLRGGFIDDHIVSVDQVFFEFVGKHALYCLHLELFSDLGDNFGDCVVGGHLSDGADGSLLSVVGCEDDIGFLSVDLSFADDDRVCGLSGVAVDVAAEINFNDISVVELGALIRQRRVVTAKLVYRNAAWERDSTLELLRLFV